MGNSAGSLADGCGDSNMAARFKTDSEGPEGLTTCFSEALDISIFGFIIPILTGEKALAGLAGLFGGSALETDFRPFS